jgi:hypothetical protein
VPFLYITEFSKLALDNTGREIPTPDWDSVTADYRMAITGGTTQSTPINSQSKCILIHTDVVCSVAYGVNPVAAVGAGRMGSGETRFFGVSAGKLIAVIANT